MHHCPVCPHRLVRTEVDRSVFWVCEGCGGRLATVGLLRQLVDRPVVERIWKKARLRRIVAGRRLDCPACTRPMVEIALAEGEVPPLDVCKQCQYFWFDAQEFESMPPPGTTPAEEPKSA